MTPMDKGKKKDTCVHMEQSKGMPYTCPLQQQAGLETTDKLRHAILLNAALQMEQEMEDYKWHHNE
jgi:hypothetical protein